MHMRTFFLLLWIPLDAQPQGMPVQARDLCHLLPGGGTGLPDSVYPMLKGAAAKELNPRPPGSAGTCGYCSAALKQKTEQPSRMAELSVFVYQWPSHEWSRWAALGNGRYPNNSKEFGDGAAYVARADGEFHFGFTVEKYQILIQGQKSSEAKGIAIARHLESVLPKETALCPGETAGRCSPAAIEAAELTSATKLAIAGENAMFSWSAGKFTPLYQLKVGTSPGGATLANYGPYTNMSAAVKMPPKASQIYVTLSSFPECGDGPPLTKSYTFQNPGLSPVK
jgi:hypothetical protein